MCTAADETIDDSRLFGSGVHVSLICFNNRHDDTINYHQALCDCIPGYKFYNSTKKFK